MFVSRPTPVRLLTATHPLLRWAATFAAFPLGGLAAHLLVGPDRHRRRRGGRRLVTGAAVGAAQWWALRPEDGPRAGRWVPASALGLAVALTAVTAVVGPPTTVGALAVQGAVSGLGLGAAQAVALYGRLGPRALLWPLLLAGAWALGWCVTAAVGVRLDDGWTVFGSSGAVLVTVLTAVLPLVLRGRGGTA